MCDANLNYPSCLSFSLFLHIIFFIQISFCRFYMSGIGRRKIECWVDGKFALHFLLIQSRHQELNDNESKIGTILKNWQYIPSLETVWQFNNSVTVNNATLKVVEWFICKTPFLIHKFIGKILEHSRERKIQFPHLKLFSRNSKEFWHFFIKDLTLISKTSCQCRVFFTGFTLYLFLRHCFLLELLSSDRNTFCYFCILNLIQVNQQFFLKKKNSSTVLFSHYYETWCLYFNIWW